MRYRGTFCVAVVESAGKTDIDQHTLSQSGADAETDGGVGAVRERGGGGVVK